MYYSGTSEERTIWDQAPLFTIQRLFAFRGFPFLSFYVLLPIIVYNNSFTHCCTFLWLNSFSMTLEYKNFMIRGHNIIKKGSLL